jgi:DNA-binding MarR family transcriptional regulator
MPPKNFCLDGARGYLAYRSGRLLANDLGRRFAAAGLPLTVEQWRVLTRLWDRDGQTQQDLAQGLMQEKTGGSRLGDGLEERSLVVRSRDDRDHRKRRVYLTVEGRKLQRRCQEAARESEGLALQRVRPQDLERCLTVLAAVNLNLAADGAVDGGEG